MTSNPDGYDEPGDYSPDGRQIVFLRTDPNRPAKASQAHFVVNVDGTGLHRISPWSNSSDSNGQSAGSWSPNGNLILYGDRRNLYTVRPDGTGLRQIMPNTTRRSFPFAPVWSPNGRRILFGMGNAQGVGVYTARPNGTHLQLVHISSAFEEPGDWGSHPLIH